jgi:hypothetical protein
MIHLRYLELTGVFFDGNSACYTPSTLIRTTSIKAFETPSLTLCSMRLYAYVNLNGRNSGF